jgi:S1-C subfamily serine protease
MFGIQAILSTLILAAIPAPQEATLLFVTTPGCELCRQLTPLVKEIAEMGFSVETVDAAQHPDLVRDQFHVQMFPTFLMLSQDRIVDRVVGGGNPITLKPRILYMFERASQQKNNEIIQASFVTPSPLPSHSTERTLKINENDTKNFAKNAIKDDAENSVNDSVRNSAGNSEKFSSWITSSVKLRVDADNTHSWGTGTIIDTRKGEALILTCGHIFRDSQGKGKIEVHLFGQNSSVRVFGRCLYYDLEIDLALVAIVPPCPVRAIPIAPPQYQILPEQRVVSIGCDGGANPTVREHYVLSTNRIGTPQKNVLPFHYIQVHGAPVSGRSGGGLFTENGYLIGVCNTADPIQNDGHFVPPSIIRHVLQSMQLSEIYENPSLVDHSSVPSMPAIPDSAAAIPARANPVIAIPVSSPQPPQLEPLKMVTQPIHAVVPAAVHLEQTAENGMDAKQRATLDEIKRRKQDGDEVILIVRSRRNPEHPYDMIILDGASDQFIDALAKQEPVPNNSSYNPVIFSSHEIPNPNLRPPSSIPQSLPIADRQPVSFPVLH